MIASTAWMVAGLVVAALEMLAPGFFMLWIGLAALGTGVAAALIPLGIEAQLGVFVVLVAALIGLAVTLIRRRPAPDRVNAPAAGLIGQTCRALSFQDGQGRVALGDGTWPARVADATRPETGQALRVVGLDGTTLLVTAYV